jgi:hypothetical protein
MEEPLPSEVKVGTLLTDEDGPAEKGARPAGKADITHGALAKDARCGSLEEKRGSGFDRTIGVIRTIVPFVQKVLPLLDGNVALAAANLLAPRLQGPPVDIHPLEESMAKMRAELTGLRLGVTTHDAALERIEEQVDAVKNSLEESAASQQSMNTSLERVQRRLTTLTVVGLFLLLASIGMNVVLLVRMLR